MTATRKFSQYDQLSLHCGTSLLQQKRKSLKKQFSEDIPDINSTWFDEDSEIRVCLKTNNKKDINIFTNKPIPVRIAWSDRIEESDRYSGMNADAEIINKNNELKVVSSTRLTRHASLEKDSILNTRQELAGIFKIKQSYLEKEDDKMDNKTNLQIFLANNIQDLIEDHQSKASDGQNNQNVAIGENFLSQAKPKLLQPLVANFGQDQVYQIKKSCSKNSLDSPRSTNQKRSNYSRSNTVVVVPFIEKDNDIMNNSSVIKDSDIKESHNDINGINVIIRPVTAQSRRERYQKRANSAFHGTSKEQPVHFRPPLVRSSSAPSTKPDKSKFLATRRKFKTSKKSSPKDENSYKTIGLNEWKNTTQATPEIVTMVSLISPGGSDNEVCSEDEEEERPRSVLKKESSIIEKNSRNTKEEEKMKENKKHVTLRKTVKSVSFQQSSIHAIRSFSASFPARRGSMASALTLGSNSNNGRTKGITISKAQEKRGTNPSLPDADERVPKRRLVRSNTEEAKLNSWRQGSIHTKQSAKKENPENNDPIIIDIQGQNNSLDTKETFLDAMKLNLERNKILITPDLKKDENPATLRALVSNEPLIWDTPKEKQCWEMYCKMTEKGITVSYDTILRGMLTPTEYRMRRKPSIAEEISLLVNKSSPENIPTTFESINTKLHIEQKCPR